MTKNKSTKKGLSLHIGLNYVDPDHYGGWNGKLTACELDARDMQIIADSQGYDSTLFLREEATRENVIGFISESSKVLKAGDILMLTYSGHGGSVPDFDNEEPDGRDETWCLFDGQLIDDELYVLWTLFKKGVRILVISDSCHSMSVIKELNGVPQNISKKIKTAPSEIIQNAYVLNKDFYDSISIKNKNKNLEINARVRNLSACQDNQFALDGIFNSAFTRQLKSVWNGGKFNKNYYEFHKKLVQLFPVDQSPGHYVIGKENKAFDMESPFKI